jgi:hypothetical protein
MDAQERRMIILILSSNCLVLISCSKNLILGKSDFSLSSSLLRCSNFFPNNFSYFTMPLFIRFLLAFHSLLEETAGVFFYDFENRPTLIISALC